MMARRGALRLVLNGAILLMIGMLIGFPGFVFGPPRAIDDEIRLFYRQTHLIPIATGAWMIAIAGILSYLSLTEGKAWILTWSLIISGYALVAAQVVWGVTLNFGWTCASCGPSAVQETYKVMQPPYRYPYLGALGLVAIGAVIGDALLILGSWSALRRLKNPVRTIH